MEREKRRRFAFYCIAHPLAVFAKQYNCRPDLVSLAIMVTLVLCVLTLPLLFSLAF
jgi:predicted permease